MEDVVTSPPPPRPTEHVPPPLHAQNARLDAMAASAVPGDFDEWIGQFKDWQARIGFDAEWLQDYEFTDKFDWEHVDPNIEFGDYAGRPKWKTLANVPRQDIKDALLQLITVQGDTEFASTEQQQHLLETAPTEYDRKAALRVMAEEQRHGWQMAYILMEYFGKEGAREAQKLLLRNAQEGTRLLGSFNQKMDNWLDFFVYTEFIDRDGKYQLKMLSTSSFLPLAASMGPMLKEEAFHLGTGAQGLRRIIKGGVVPPSLVQKYFNKWVSTAYDLFGVDNSSSAEWSYVWGLKGRFDEREADEAADRKHLNERARQQYHDEVSNEIRMLNESLPEGAEPLFAPSMKFRRSIGVHAGEQNLLNGDPYEGSAEQAEFGEYQAYLDSVVPNAEDIALMEELTQRPDWIEHRAPPKWTV